MTKTSVVLAGVELKNPVMTASGTFGSGMEYSEFVDLNRLGAVVTKGVANIPWPGNPTPRVAETPSGMLNAIGLQNPGIDVFCSRDLPFLKKYDTKVIVNVCGKTTEDYCQVVERLGSEPVDLLEINVSCPNVKEGGIAFGQDPKALEAITKEVKKIRKTAGDHEAEPKCDRYYGNGPGCGSRGSGCAFSDKYADRNEDRYQKKKICPGKQDRRHVRPGGKTDCCTYGISGGSGSETADHRNGRHCYGRRRP